MKPKVLTLDEVAEQLRFPAGPAGRKRVLRLIHGGQLRAVQAGREYRVPVEALEKFLAGSVAQSA